MILFMSVFVNHTNTTSHLRGLLPVADRLSVFKYSLASLAPLSWSKVIIYYKLGDMYAADQYDETDKYILSLFPGAMVHRYRLAKQKQWQEAMEEVFALQDELVWFCCNDDHVFLDYETDLIERIERSMLRILPKHEYLSCYYSHLPEMLCHVCYNKPHPIIDITDDYFTVAWANIDSIQLVNKNLLRYWWFSRDYGDVTLVRTDGKFPNTDYERIDIAPVAHTLIPCRELCRHFDGYQRDCFYGYNHVYKTLLPICDDGSVYDSFVKSYTSDITRCPVLTIPPGFFENDIKIAYGFPERREGWVHVNPMIENYYCTDIEHGVDYKWVLEDLPVFWRHRISNIDINTQIDMEGMLQARNKAMTAFLNSEIAFRAISETIDMKHLKIAFRSV